VLIFPNRLDVVFKEINARSNWKFGRSLELLIIGPELLDGLNGSHWFQTVFEAIFSLHELLIPKFELGF
jgi:hypothetical protein